MDDFLDFSKTEEKVKGAILQRYPRRTWRHSYPRLYHVPSGKHLGPLPYQNTGDRTQINRTFHAGVLRKEKNQEGNNANRRNGTKSAAPFPRKTVHVVGEAVVSEDLLAARVVHLLERAGLVPQIPRQATVRPDGQLWPALRRSLPNALHR